MTELKEFRFVCGTKRVTQNVGTYRVVCATCGAGGTVPHRTKEAATKAAVRDSMRACRACGAA
jgi:hypothetical protein